MAPRELGEPIADPADPDGSRVIGICADRASSWETTSTFWRTPSSKAWKSAEDKPRTASFPRLTNTST